MFYATIVLFIAENNDLWTRDSVTVFTQTPQIEYMYRNINMRYNQQYEHV